MEQLSRRHVMHRSTFDYTDSAVASSLQQCRIQIKAGNAPGRRFNWQSDDFGSVKNPRRTDLWIAYEASFSHQRA